MFKQYIYQPHQLYRDSWPEGELDLTFPITEDAAQADLFVVPGNFTKIFNKREDMYKLLRFFRGREHQHVMMSLGEDNKVYDLPCIFLRSNLKTWMLDRDENSISIPWPVDDLGHYSQLPPTGFKYDVSFHGWVNTRRGKGTRAGAIKSCQNQPQLECDIQTYSTFFGHQPAHEQGVRRVRYGMSLQQSRVALCPESIPGDIPYRFYEAMSVGRIPMLVGSDYVLPYKEELERLTIFQVAAHRAIYTGAELVEMLGIANSPLTPYGDEKILEAGERLREFWLSRLNPLIWHDSFTHLVQSKLESIKGAQIEL